MGEITINPIHNVHKKYRQMNLVNPYLFANSYDIDAQAFIISAMLTDDIHKNSINKLVLDLKLNGLWDKLQVIYPFIGGNEISHKFNLKDPRNLNDAFRLLFSGTLLHNNNGVTFISGIGDCNFSPTLNMVINDYHYSAYCRNQILGECLIKSSANMQMFANVSNLLLDDSYNNSGGVGRIVASNTSSIGYFSATRLSSPIKHSIYKNGVLKASNATTVGSLGLQRFFLCATDGGPKGSNLAFVTIGRGLTDTENTILYNIIQDYQTILNRQV